MPWHSQARHDVLRIAVQLGDDRINQTVTLWIIVCPSNDGSERRFDNGSVRPVDFGAQGSDIFQCMHI